MTDPDFEPIKAAVTVLVEHVKTNTEDPLRVAVSMVLGELFTVYAQLARIEALPAQWREAIRCGDSLDRIDCVDQLERALRGENHG